MSFPTISAVIATIGSRPELLRTAVRSIMEQDYPGDIEVIVVFDHVEIDTLSDIQVPQNRALKTIPNERPQGLAGGRNSGILAASGELIGFCDDDDYWYKNKISRQVQLWAEHPQAIAISSGITIRTAGEDVQRLAPQRATFTDFLQSRITEIHPSAMLYRKEDLNGGKIGLVDEQLPSAYGEDYDLLLRATQHADILSVQDPLILVLWDRPSFFAGKWQSMVNGLTYLLQKFPEFEQQPRGLARISGQVAFAYAALGNSQQARRWAKATLSRDITQLRAWAAYIVSTGLVKPQVLLDLVQKTGRGL
ncbi:glycosyltransferase family 2 protein [Rothia sp. P7208]|uniref:glycosyltransferase family 2 protein n=1 Tax=Rothia sp. P7208 TaxID=3402660 RepID=UPI003AC5A846